MDFQGKTFKVSQVQTYISKVYLNGKTKILRIINQAVNRKGGNQPTASRVYYHMSRYILQTVQS